jgi:sugar-specific transcriptional regulator TrmB
MYKKDLLLAGLKENEADIYMLLLSDGAMSARDILNRVKYKKGLTYKILGDLSNKGFIKEFIKNGVRIYSPKEPKELLKKMDEKISSLEKNRDDVQNLVKLLEPIFQHSTEKPLVTTFEGIEGIKEVYKDTLRVKDNLLAFLKINELDSELENWLYDYYNPKRRGMGMKADVIVSVNDLKKSHAERYLNKDFMQSDGLTRTIEVDSKDYPMDMEINIYGQKVSFVDLSNKDKMVGLIIDNVSINTALKSIFKMAWERFQN